MLKEFKAFIMKGNVIDLAVAVVIGGAFGAIISSLVGDVVISWILFLIVKAFNAIKKQDEAPAPPPGPTQEELLTQIRDLLKK